MDAKDQMLSIIGTLYKWRKHIIYTCVAAALGTAFISVAFLPTYYKSTTSFYPASPDLAKPQPVGQIERDIDYYGEPEDLDRLMSVANSGEVVDFMIHKFDLYKHYEINAESKKGPYNIRKHFSKLYTIKKSKYSGIELSIEDKDPQMAADIANEAREKINRISQKLVKKSQEKLIETFEDNIKEKEEKINQLNDSLFVLRKEYGIYDTKSQGQVLSELQTKVEGKLNNLKAKLEVASQYSKYRDSSNYYRVSIKGLETQNESLKEQLNKYNQGLARVVVLEEEQDGFGRQLSLDKERLKQLNSSYKSSFNALHILEPASVPIIKSRPRRSLYVIGATMFAFILSVLGVLIVESSKSIKWKEVLNDK